MLIWIKRLLASQRGEVGDEDPNATAQDADTGTGEAANADDPLQAGQQPEQGTEQAAATDATQGEDTFLSGSDLDPRKLPPELQPIFKRMQGVYTKKFQEHAALREKAEMVDRFNADRNYAQQTLVGWAAQNGYQLVPIGQQGQTGQAQPQQGASQAPGQLVEVFKQKLGPELAWMAEPLAEAMGQSMQSMLSPVLQQQQQAQQAQRAQEWERYADDLRGVAPGWEEHEDTMSELYDFMVSPQLSHPKYGSKLEMLYNLATAKAAAIRQATDRVNAAAKNRTSSGRSGATRVPAIGDQIAKAKTSEDAWELAKKHALQSVQRS